MLAKDIQQLDPTTRSIRLGCETRADSGLEEDMQKVSRQEQAMQAELDHQRTDNPLNVKWNQSLSR